MWIAIVTALVGVCIFAGVVSVLSIPWVAGSDKTE